MSDEVKQIEEKVILFRRKYYFNTFLKGCLLSATILLAYFVIAAVLEYAFWLDSSLRFFILSIFVGTTIFCVYIFLKEPLRFWLGNKGLSTEESARLIGKQLPEVNDRLVNFFQLTSQAEVSILGAASVKQKASEFRPLSFETIINLGDNLLYAKYLSIPVIVIIGILFINKSILTQSSQRIINFNQKFSPQAPFQFFINNGSTQSFRNENFILSIRLEGNAIPEEVFCLYNNMRMKMLRTQDGSFTYQFDRLQKDVQLQVEAAGFYSEIYTIQVVPRPELMAFEVLLSYPSYLQRIPDKIGNAGNLVVPEGTKIQWNVQTQEVNLALLQFSSTGAKEKLQLVDNQVYTFERSFQEPEQYELILKNENGTNKDQISYSIDVIKDKHPEIAVISLQDSILFKHINFSGRINDDYGVRNLNLVLQEEGTKKNALHKISVPIVNNQYDQNFFFHWSLDTLRLQAGEKISYYFEVWDNDGVNGSKSTKSATYTFSLPTKEELETNIRQSEKATKQKIAQSQANAKELQKQLEQITQQLKSKQNLSWQDKKKLEDIIQQKKELEKMLDELKQDSQQLINKKETFTEESERIKEKAEQIQKLMEQLLDDETKKLFEELEKLLKENADTRDMEQLLDKMKLNSGNMEKELDRALELFKQLQLESKVEQATEDLKNNIEEQKQLLNDTEKTAKENKSKNNPTETKNPQELAKKQEEVANDFKKLEDKLEEIKELDKEISGNDLEMPTDEQQQTVEQQQEQSKKSLEEGKPGKSKEAQQKAMQEMQAMQEKMEAMQSAMGMEMDMENLESLRQIIHGLIKLSFDQENLITSFRELNQSDPRFNTLAQRQIKVKDDSKVLEDSLLALGKRDPMMGSFITKEISELNSHLDNTIEANRERRRAPAQSEMQFSMTSINNLTLMLDDHFDAMMQMLANAKPSAGKGKKKGKPQSLSQMQQQLNQRIQELKNGGKSGKQLSEELAKTAAEQERIRKALQEFQEKMKQQGKEMPGGDLLNKMEQSEMDLVNKQLTDQLIRRQKEIETRLLETEQSMREQEEEEERKSESAKDYTKEIPKAFEEYLRLKEKELELLKTVPIKLQPYYKKEVSEYFKRLREQ